MAFSSLARILGGRFDGHDLTINSPPALLLLSFLFLRAEISSRTLVPRFRPGSAYTGSASWDKCVLMFPDELRVNSIFLIGSHTLPGRLS